MKFATQARVTVPGANAQAVICDATETVPGFPIYTLRWLDEAGETHTGTCGEGDLATANPTDDDVARWRAEQDHREDSIECIVNLRVDAKLTALANARRRALRVLRKKAKVSKRKR